MFNCSNWQSGIYTTQMGMHDVTHTDGKQCKYVPEGHGNASIYGWCPYINQTECPNYKTKVTCSICGDLTSLELMKNGICNSCYQYGGNHYEVIYLSEDEWRKFILSSKIVSLMDLYRDGFANSSGHLVISSKNREEFFGKYKEIFFKKLLNIQP